MTSPFAGAGEFAPVTREKNAREQVIEYAERHGWVLDLTATRMPHTWKEELREQDPNRFVLATPEMGGHWCLLLNYEVVGDPEKYTAWRKWDNTLRAVEIWHSSWVNDRGVATQKFELRNYIQSNSARSVLWDLTNREDGKFKPLRKRAEELLREPTLLVWLAVEDKHSAAEAERQRRAEWAHQQSLRRKPIPVVGSISKFREAANKLRRVAGDIGGADGLTNLHDLVKEAEDLLGALRESLVEYEPTCFYCDAPVTAENRALDPSNHRTYGPCCRDHALRFEKKYK